MTREDSTKIVDKIKIYRQSFLITNKVYEEWFRKLEPYDYQDVDNKLDEYFKNGENFGKYPDVYYLIKYLHKHDEKLKNGIIYVRCQLCKKIINYKEHDLHYNRCSSAHYICKMSQKYYNKKMNIDKLMSASDEDFEKYYWDFCNNLIPKINSKVEKHILTNAIMTHKGYNPTYELTNILGEKNDRAN